MKRSGYEAEFLFRLPDRDAFSAALADLMPANQLIEETHQYVQTSIYLDVPGHALCRNNASLALRLVPDQTIRAFVKYGFCSLIEDQLLIRAEATELLDTQKLTFSEELGDKLKGLIGNQLELLQPVLVAKQTRYHRVTQDRTRPVHLSIDQVTFTNPNTQASYECYMMELEVTDTDLGQLSFSRIRNLSTYYKEKYHATSLYPSKYLQGLMSVCGYKVDESRLRG